MFSCKVMFVVFCEYLLNVIVVILCLVHEFHSVLKTKQEQLKEEEQISSEEDSIKLGRKTEDT